MSRFNNGKRVEIYMSLVEQHGEICQGGYSQNCERVPCEPGTLEIDHGDNSEHHNCMRNLRGLLCHACNVKKGMEYKALVEAHPEFNTAWLRHPYGVKYVQVQTPEGTVYVRESERENPGTPHTGNGGNGNGKSAAAGGAKDPDASSLQGTVRESISAGTKSGPPRKIARPGHDAGRRSTETSPQRANRKREGPFVEFVYKLMWGPDRYDPGDIIDAGAQAIGGSPVAYARYMRKLTNPINGPFIVLSESGKDFLDFRDADTSKKSKDWYEKGQCVFCGTRRNEGKVMCDDCTAKYTDE